MTIAKLERMVMLSVEIAKTMAMVIAVLIMRLTAMYVSAKMETV